MTTSSVDREVLRAWRDTHDDVRPARNGEKCVHFVWIDKAAWKCGKSAQWVVDYKQQTNGLLGKRPHCEAHTVSVLSKWSAFERGEVPA
jgi:hypothetical protein